LLALKQASSCRERDAENTRNTNCKDGKNKKRDIVLPCLQPSLKFEGLASSQTMLLQIHGLLLPSLHPPMTALLSSLVFLLFFDTFPSSNSRLVGLGHELEVYVDAIF